MGNASLIWGVLFLPLIGFLVQACFGGSIVKSGNDSAGKRVSGILAVLFIAVPFILGLIITKDLASLPADARFHVVTWFYTR